MTTQRYADGAFCFYRTSAACQPMFLSNIERLATRHGISTSMIPAYAGDRAQVSRAILAVSGKIARKWKLTGIKTGSHEVVHGISAVRIDQQNEKCTFPQEDCLRWSDEGGNGQYIEGQHPVACAVNAEYQSIKERICPGDWSETLKNYLLDECQAFPFREDGRVYWIPPQTLAKLAPLTAFLADVGISLVVCEVETQARTIVQQAASESLQDKLTALKDEVDAFTGDEKPSNMKRRIGELEKLRRRAQTYQDALGIGVDQAQAVLDTLQGHVERLLGTRQATVVHRNGNRSHPNGAPSAALAPVTAEVSW